MIRRSFFAAAFGTLAAWLGWKKPKPIPPPDLLFFDDEVRRRSARFEPPRRTLNPDEFADRVEFWVSAIAAKENRQ